MSLKKSIILGLGLTLAISNLINAPQGFAQSAEQGADQSAFQDDDELLRLNNSQVRQMEGEEQNAEQQASFDDQRNQAYRLYAEKRVADLEKLKASSANKSELSIFQRWLKADSATRLRDQQTINSLRQRIANLEQTQQQVMTNLGGDVGAMREASNNARADDKFRQQMQINYFNEMQSEMGPATWRHPTSGPTYGMGGMGFNGGQQLFGGY